MYIPKYTITTEILKNIGWIEAAKEVIDNAPLVPAWEAKFRDEARLKAAHYGTVLEGNDLTLGQAKLIMDRAVENPAEAAEAGVVARERDVQEVINYRKVLELIEGSGGLEGKEGLEYRKEILLDIHKLVVEKLVEEGQAGNFRQVQVVLRNSVTREIGFRPPAAAEVAGLVGEFLGWLNSEKGKGEHPVLRAGVAHYVLAAVHPFVEGNGRTARAFATMVLYREGYDIRRFFALEEYFDRNAEEYFGSLMEVSNQSSELAGRDLTSWMTVFTRALATELTRIKDQVRELSVDIKIKQRMGRQVALTERQMKLMEYLHSNGEMTMGEAKTVLSMVSEDTILRELKALIEKGVIMKRGSTKAARYVLKK
ncbi:Fic family protein [Candidatus Amesbacteria bacterium]|nr:Fic family protein [Candidatus Amesbacteria bacterium]